jgi:hypothetical protein
MGKTLLADQFSVQVRTIRAYQDKNGELLHIFHTLKAVVRRPDRLLVDVNGDDGARKFLYDGKSLVLYRAEKKQYVSMPVPNELEGMLQVATSRLGVDFPLADFLTKAPNKAFLTGGAAGREVNTVIIDGVQCRHLFFSKPPGIEEELWVEENDQSLPRRLIVTYRLLPGQPRFVAEFLGWDFSIHPSDADFVFQPPEGATKVELKSGVATPEQKGGK